VKIYFDGGCRPNPGNLETAVVAGGVLHLRTDHGMGDNSDGEWLALIEAARLAQALGVQDAILIGDNKMVIDQASGRAPRISTRFHAH
jgi:ribonuclease HI